MKPGSTKFRKIQPQQGFTLIELLVVIAIISLISSIVLASLNSAKMKARDARRIQDLSQIRTALELYYNENGYYPKISRWATSEPTSYDSGTGWTSLQNALSEFMSKLPGDPKPTGSSGPWSNGNYHYAYGASSNGQIYDLVAQLENQSNENTCRYKCWRYHNGEGSYPPGTPWCSVCPSGANWSLYMYADH